MADEQGQNSQNPSGITIVPQLQTGAATSAPVTSGNQNATPPITSPVQTPVAKVTETPGAINVPLNTPNVPSAVSAEAPGAQPVPQTQTIGIEEKNPQPNKAPQSVDQTLDKINRGFKERATIEKAKQLNMQYINISVTPINPDLLKLLSPEVVKSALVMPFFKIGKRIRVAVADPENAVTKAVLQDLINKGYELNINLSSDEGILEAARLYEGEQYKVKKALDTHLSEDKIKAYEQEIQQLTDLKTRLPNLSSEEAVYLISVGALKTGASDMHFEPEEKSTRVRFRIDGVLHAILTLKKVSTRT